MGRRGHRVGRAGAAADRAGRPAGPPGRRAVGRPAAAGVDRDDAGAGHRHAVAGRARHLPRPHPPGRGAEPAAAPSSARRSSTASSPRSRPPCSPTRSASRGRRTSSSTPRRSAGRRKAEGETKLSAYESRAKEVGSGLGDPAKLKISLIRFRPDEIRQYGPESFSGIVLNDIGLGRPQGQLLEGAEDRRFAPLSPERIGEADGDFIFVSAFGAKAAAAQAKVTAGPLWQRLDAVKAGHAKVVDDETWMTGIGVTAAGKILDDVQKYLTPPAKG
ncbi:MAG: ABC transporter substrate-binding protein [Streptosporangiales bacterium]|nr:ABC transporter substrate-binding protein [Streptosporangiales bacterium]